MDDLRFDLLAKSIATPASRRGLLGGLAGGLAALVGLAGDADAKKGKKNKNKKKKKCKGNKKKCKGKCIKKSQCCKNSDCGNGAVCSGKQCVCPDGTKDCDGACIPTEDCCTNGDCGDCESCQNGSCTAGCQGSEICCDTNVCQECCTSADCGACETCENGTCSASCQNDQICCDTNVCQECCTSAECTSDPEAPVCDAGVCVCAPDAETCESGEGCCSGVCACDGGKPTNPEDGTCHGDTFLQDFESNVDGWYDWNNTADAWPGTTTTIQLADGHAVLTPGDYNVANALTPMTLWGGYSNELPPGGYNTEIDVFLDPVNADANRQFAWSSAINGDDCLYNMESMFHGGTDENGTFCVSAGGGASTQPCNENFDPIEINTADWYTLRHQFRDNGGNEVKVTMKLIRGNTLLRTWTETSSNGPLGGNRYGWFPFNNFPNLAIDNSKRS